MKKIVLFLLAFLFVYNISFASDIDLSCKKYFDGCNNCSRLYNGGEMACTMMACEKTQEPKCLEYFSSGTSIGIANPASVYCNDNGGSLVIEKDKTGGEYGVCNFLDGSSCEEWSFFRGECTNKSLDPIMCTMEYAPVCGEKQVQCIKAPCNPIKQTYGNKCSAGAENAKILYDGECLSDKIEKQIDNTLLKFLSKFTPEQKNIISKKLDIKINTELEKNDITYFFRQVLNYVKYYLNK